MPTTVDSSPLSPIGRQSTAALVADSIRASIVAGEFPSGTQLTETWLSEQLEVSRGPIREAFQRLIQEGIVVAEPHRGVFVVALDADAAADVYTARRAIEREAARELVRRGDAAVVRTLDALVKTMARAATKGSWAAIAGTDLEFHETLVRASGSDRLSRMYATLLVETRLCLAALGATDPDPKQVVAEHRALVKALRSGDEAEVLDQIDRHLERSSPSSER